MVAFKRLAIDGLDVAVFTAQRDLMLTEIAKIFAMPSEVVERAHLNARESELEWEPVRVLREIEMSEGHEGCKDLEMEESACGWGHKLTGETPRKVKGFRVSPEAFLQALTTQGIGNLRWTKVIRGIPSGARSLGATYELASRCWIVYIEHSSFPAVETGVRAPLCEIVFHEMHFEGLIARLTEINRLVEQRHDDELSEKIRPHIRAIMKLYFPEETLET